MISVADYLVVNGVSSGVSCCGYGRVVFALAEFILHFAARCRTCDNKFDCRTRVYEAGFCSRRGKLCVRFCYRYGYGVGYFVIGVRFVSLDTVENFVSSGISRCGNRLAPLAVFAEFILDRSVGGSSSGNERVRESVVHKTDNSGCFRGEYGRFFGYSERNDFIRAFIIGDFRNGRLGKILTDSRRHRFGERSVSRIRVCESRRAELCGRYRRNRSFAEYHVGNGEVGYFVIRLRNCKLKRYFVCVAFVRIFPRVLTFVGKFKNYVVLADVYSAFVGNYFVPVVFRNRRSDSFAGVNRRGDNRSVEFGFLRLRTAARGAHGRRYGQAQDRNYPS